jgi:hypothetical protein
VGWLAQGGRRLGLEPGARAGRPPCTGPKKLFKEDLDLLVQHAEFFRTQNVTNFWELTFSVDVKLISALVKQELTTEAGVCLAREYAAAARRGSSARELDSVIAQIRFLETMADVDGNPAMKQVAAHISALAAAIEGSQKAEGRS